jgi:hypothetical protein
MKWTAADMKAARARNWKKVESVAEDATTLNLGCSLAREFCAEVGEV